MSNKKLAAHQVVKTIKDMTSELGHVPSRDEIRAKTSTGKDSFEWAIRKCFGSYTAALHAAGFTGQELPGRGSGIHGRGIHNKNSFKYVKTQLQGFIVNRVSLEELFDRAGNPDVLKMVAQPDTHAPNENRSTINAFCQFMEWYKPDVHTIMGDFVDMQPVSHFAPDSFEPRRLVPELVHARKLLKEICDASRSCSTRYYIEGNHEDWLRQALVAKIPEVADGISELLPEGVDLNLQTFLELDKLGFQFQKLNELLKIGKAHFTHGLYTNQHHAAKHLTTFGANIYYGHLHDVQSFNKMSIDGPIEAASLGCMCVPAAFMKGRPNNWVQSFGIFEFFPDGSYTMYKPYILGGRFSYGGKVFDGNVKSKAAKQKK